MLHTITTSSTTPSSLVELLKPLATEAPVLSSFQSWDDISFSTCIYVLCKVAFTMVDYILPVVFVHDSGYVTFLKWLFEPQPVNQCLA